PLFATSWSPTVSRVRPTGAVPGAKVFHVAPVVEVSATAGDAVVTGNARIILGPAEGEAAARDIVSLGEVSASVTGCARGASSGVEAAWAMATRSLDFTKFPLRFARSGGGGGSSISGTAGSTRTSASSGGGATLTGGSPTMGSALVAGATRDR